ncbi:SLOG family protein [Desulfonatronovibrio hydrogenovorans]|uniref:SLOG family protein n=1 Tax=Desulfonatronovibrio hydrogenovorans TaxID=53245 RepID=UPI0005535E7F|nr:SLOG family protein [Desulfonatronovibrio hydrogenovorans]
MKAGIIGSRNFNNYNLMCKVLDTMDITEIVSGGAKGADTLAQRYAIDRALPFKVFLPLHKTDPNIAYHVKWYFMRNCDLVDYSDQIVAFWDGLSRGTKFTIDYARKQKKPLLIPGHGPC